MTGVTNAFSVVGPVCGITESHAVPLSVFLPRTDLASRNSESLSKSSLPVWSKANPFDEWKKEYAQEVFLCLGSRIGVQNQYLVSIKNFGNSDVDLVRQENDSEFSSRYQPVPLRRQEPNSVALWSTKDFQNWGINLDFSDLLRRSSEFGQRTTTSCFDLTAPPVVQEL